MRKLSTIFIAAAMAAAAQTAAAQTYTATNLQSTNSPYQVAGVYGLNNQGQVLVDICANESCVGLNRLLGVWSNGVITPLQFPAGYTYSASPSFFHINDSGTVVGVGIAGVPSHVVVWMNGVAAVLPDAPYSSDFSGSGCPYSLNGSSIASGINAAGSIVGSTTYTQPGTGLQCSARWVYDGSGFRVVPFPVPPQCVGILPPAYDDGVTEYAFPALNDAEQVLETVQNLFCGPPYANPNPPFPSEDPAVIQPSGSYSFLPLGTLAGAAATSINNIGDVLGFYGTNGSGSNNLVVWDKNGVHALGESGYGYMNQVGQVVYLTTPCIDCGGGLAIWQNGISTPVQLPEGLVAEVPGAINDTGQIVVGTAGGVYLLTPTGPCAQDVTSQVQITPTGFRYNHSTGLFALIGSITNTGGTPIPGPISLVVDNLPTSATLFGIDGDTLCAVPQGSPYINVGHIGTGQALAPGASVSGSIDFIDTANAGITYSLRVLAGPGGR